MYTEEKNATTKIIEENEGRKEGTMVTFSRHTFITSERSNSINFIESSFYSVLH